jgi:Rap1a immunity proteins
MTRVLLLCLDLLLVCCLMAPSAHAEFRSAKDMQKECRVALKVLNGTAEKSFDNILFAGECVGYVQGAVDASQALAENTSWYKVCTPDNLSTGALIQKFIAFVDANPKYTLASTAVQMMLAQEYACKK